MRLKKHSTSIVPLEKFVHVPSILQPTIAIEVVDTLDNRRLNLRLCTQCKTQNEANKGLKKDNTSGYKGVRMLSHFRNKPWMVYIGYNHKKIFRSLSYLA